MTVLTAAGGPVHDLRIDDFVVLVDGVSREVVRAAPATTPLSVALMTDQLGLSSTYTLVDVRAAFSLLVQQLREATPGVAFALMTFDGAVRRVIEFRSSPLLLDRAIRELTPAGPDAYFMDAIMHVARRGDEFPTHRRAIVALLGTYRTEGSTTRTDELGDALRDSGASLWAVEAVAQDRGSYPDARRELVLESATVKSGGAREVVVNRGQLVQAVRRVTTRLASQYHLSYGGGNWKAGSQLTVGVKRQGLKVLAPAWILR